MGIQINGQTDTISSTDGSLNIGGTVTVNVTGDATGLTGTPDITVGAVTASSATISGDLTVNGTTTTLDTTLTEVDKLEVGANNTTVGVAITQSGTGDILRLYDSSTQVVTVKDGGSVGIGTDNPIRSLDIQAPINENIPLVIRSGPNQTNGFIAIKDPNTTGDFNNRIGSEGNNLLFWSNGGEKLRITSGGNVGIGLTNPGQKLTVKGTTSLMATNSTNQWMAYTYTDNTFRLNYNGSGADEVVMTSDGKIGIGEDSPETLLHLKSATAPMLTIQNTTNTSYTGIQFDRAADDTQFAIYSYDSSHASEANNVQLYNYQVGDISLHTNSQERLRIKSDGNVGIGITNPSTKLDLYRVGSGVAGRFGKETIWGEFQVDGQRIGIQGTRSSDNAITGFFVENPSSTGTSNFNSVSIKTAGYERFRIENDGSQFASQRYSGANDSYVKRSWRHFQSAFNNPTVNLATFSIGTQNAGIAIYVRVVHIEYYGTATSPGIISEGLASIRRESTVYTTYAGTMSVIKSATASNVGTLSWSGQTLQYTPNRVANYDSYYVEFEAFGTLGNAHTITPSW